MKAFLTGFILPLCILLLGGYSQYHASAYLDVGHYYSIKPHDPSEPALIVKATPTEKEKYRKEATEFRETEEKEFEVTASKRCSESSSYLSAITYRQPLANFCEHSPYQTSLNSYLVFRVIRI